MELLVVEMQVRDPVGEGYLFLGHHTIFLCFLCHNQREYLFGCGIEIIEANQAHIYAYFLCRTLLLLFLPQPSLCRQVCTAEYSRQHWSVCEINRRWRGSNQQPLG